MNQPVKPKKKRKRHFGMYNIGHEPHNKSHSKYFHFEDARKVIRAEHIPSIKAFEVWWKLNMPVRVPYRPDRIYKKHGWISWNDFLGNNNPFMKTGDSKIIWMPFDEARAWAREKAKEHDLKSRVDWFNFCQDVEKKNRPKNIPFNPSFAYRDDWYTWNDWLGVGSDIKTIVKETINIMPLLYVIKLSHSPSNVFKVNVTHGGKKALEEVIKQGAKIIAVFEYTSPIEWREILTKYSNQYWNGDNDDYSFSNINGFLFDLSTELTQFKL